MSDELYALEVKHAELVDQFEAMRQQRDALRALVRQADERGDAASLRADAAEEQAAVNCDEVLRLREVLAGIAQFDPYEPAGPAASRARNALKNAAATQGLSHDPRANSAALSVHAMQHGA